MNETKHTPGPWRVENHRFKTTTESRWTVWSGSEAIAWTNGTDDESELAQQEANARLIAAAPELLAACKNMLEWARRVKQINPGPEIVNAINAIAKAEGRGE